MKLELKHIAPYLPYGLKIKGNTYGEIKTLYGIKGESVFIDTLTTPYSWADFSDIKPILRSLSDLTNEIEIEGKKFVPKCELDCICRDLEFYSFNFKYFTVGNQHKNYGQEYDLIDIYNVMQKLFEWHFDIFGLIESGLAVDIDTLNREL